jgi:hypothetical protein
MKNVLSARAHGAAHAATAAITIAASAVRNLGM